MFCEKCGKQISSDDKFCSECGYTINRVNEIENKKNKRKSMNRIIISLVIVLLLVPISTFIIYHKFHPMPKNVSERIYNDAIKWLVHFEDLKKENKKDNNISIAKEWAEFCANKGNEETKEERAILDEVLRIGFTYEREISGEKYNNIEDSFDYRVKNLKKMLKLE